MKISVSKPGVGRPRTLVLFAKGKDLLGPWKRLGGNLQKSIDAQAGRDGFKGKPGQVLCFYPGTPAERVIVAGVGGGVLEAGHENLRRAAAEAFKKAVAVSESRIFVLVPNGRESRDLTQAVTEGMLLMAYRFEKYKAKENPTSVKQIILVNGDARGARMGEAYAGGTCVTRDLVNEHAGWLTPRRMAEVARKVCRGLTVQVRDARWIESKGMNALRAVSLGSSEPPRLVHIRYRAPGARKTVALVGKAVTFDSGGLCLKSSEGMLQMKADMSGGATVVGIMSALRKVKPRVNVHGIFGATENMPGQGAYKMRDVIRAMNGKTIEITNTDAEGRVTMADTLSYASTLKPDAIIDMATLTGACVVALGPRWCGILGTNQKLVDALQSSAGRAGERIWQLPLEDEYFEDYLKSEVADMKNAGGRWAGTIQGGLFLKQFVDPKIPWAHIDMAGAALGAAKKHYCTAGASGVLTRTILRYLETFR
jgi:leucyl aminopeptidase